MLREKARYRRNTGTFLIEGMKEITLAFNAGYEIENIMPIISEICKRPTQSKYESGLGADYIEKSLRTCNIFFFLLKEERIIGISCVLIPINNDLDVFKTFTNKLPVYVGTRYAALRRGFCCTNQKGRFLNIQVENYLVRNHKIDTIYLTPANKDLEKYWRNLGYMSRYTMPKEGEIEPAYLDDKLVKYFRKRYVFRLAPKVNLPIV